MKVGEEFIKKNRKRRITALNGKYVWFAEYILYLNGWRLIKHHKQKVLQFSAWAGVQV